MQSSQHPSQIPSRVTSQTLGRHLRQRSADFFIMKIASPACLDTTRDPHPLRRTVSQFGELEPQGNDQMCSALWALLERC